MVPLIMHYRKKIKDKILITTTTLSSAEFCLNTFKNYSNVVHQFAPLDTPQIIKKFFKHWNPRISIFVEFELWPNLIFLSKKKSKLILINARLSKKSFNKWKYIKKSAKNLLSQFEIIISQNKETLFFMRKLGINNIITLGNLKFASIKKLQDVNNFNFRKVLNETWVAMSTHQGEEEFIINTLKILKKKI